VAQERRAGELDKGFFYQPTLLTNVPDDARIATEECFGPRAARVPLQGPRRGDREGQQLDLRPRLVDLDQES
jgi:hypothetical protein